MPVPVISIIAPIFNEIESLPELYRRVKEVMETSGEEWELILVDDGSEDGSTDAIRALAKQNERVRPVIFARNFGHQIAVTAGLDYSRGNAVVTIDADLQDPPEVILDLIKKWREGYHVVYAVRAEREGATWFKYPFRKMFRLALNAITSFSYFPLQLATYLGFFSAGISILFIPVVAILRFTGRAEFFGQASTLISVLFFGGVQLICLGILGEYIGRIYDEVKGRPLYTVSEGPDDFTQPDLK
jgi:glycosyltransferase involved in cell wall biosynthesis